MELRASCAQAIVAPVRRLGGQPVPTRHVVVSLPLCCYAAKARGEKVRNAARVFSEWLKYVSLFAFGISQPLIYISNGSHCHAGKENGPLAGLLMHRRA